MNLLATLTLLIGLVAILCLLMGAAGTDAIFPTIFVILGIWALIYIMNVYWQQEAVRNGVAHWESVTSEVGSIEHKFVWNTKDKNK